MQILPMWLALALPVPLAAAQEPGLAAPAQAGATGSPAAGFDVEFRAARIRELSSYIEERFDVPPRKATTIVAQAVDEGWQNGLHPELVLAVIAVESTFKEKAVSRTGARGLMQIQPRAHPAAVRRIGGARKLFDPRHNIATGSRILATHLKRSRGNLRRALLRYNGSLANPRSRYPDKVLRFYAAMRKVSDLSQPRVVAESDPAP